MEIRKLKTNCTIFNVTLAKNTGLYQMFDPETIKLKNHNVYNVVNVIFVLYTFFLSIIFLVNGVNLWTKYPGHKTDTILNVIYAETSLFACYKICVIINRSQDTQDCFPIARFDFTSIGLQHADLLKLWRNRSFKFTNLYAYMTYISGIVFVTWPLYFENTFSALTTADGSTSYYRSNVLNLFTLFSAETYNANFYLMYFLEISGVMIFIYFCVIFDTMFAELCLSLVCHLQIINTALELMGHEPVTNHQNQNNRSGKSKSKTTDERFIEYDNLKAIIKDYQAVIQKFDKLLSTFGDVVRSQIFVSSSFFILVWYTIIKKESIIFSLYSCNWTDMDMKCKKLVFMTMMMNNANQKKLKFTPLRVVNLALFLGTMRIVYSVLSVMLKI